MCVLDLAMSASSAAPASKRAKTDDDTKGMMKTLIDRLVARENLSAADVSRATEAIAAGRVDPTQISAFLVLLRAKGETSEEVAALVTVRDQGAMGVPCTLLPPDSPPLRLRLLPMPRLSMLEQIF